MRWRALTPEDTRGRKRARSSLATALRRHPGRTQLHSRPGVNVLRTCNITPHSAKLPHSLRCRCVRCGNPALRRALRVRGMAPYVLRPGPAAKPSCCAGGRKGLVRVTARAPSSRRRRASPSIRKQPRKPNPASSAVQGKPLQGHYFCLHSPDPREPEIRMEPVA